MEDLRDRRYRAVSIHPHRIDGWEIPREELTKQAVYQQSVYTLTKTILAEEWTPNALATRQRHLAQWAVYIWRSDFSL